MKSLSFLDIRHIKNKIKIDLEKTIVLIDKMDPKIYPDEKSVSNNIYCVNKNFEIIWQVSSNDTPFHDNDPFLYLDTNKKGEIVIQNFSGDEYILNPETGIATWFAWNK